MESLNFSCLLKPDDLRNILQSHNGILRNLKQFEDEAIQTKKQKEEL